MATRVSSKKESGPAIVPTIYGDLNQKELNILVTRGLFGYTNPLVNMEEMRLKEEMRKYLEVFNHIGFAN